MPETFFPQVVLAAFRAACTALSMSFLPPAAMVVMTLPVAGWRVHTQYTYA